jgi:hypothetical protein
MNGSRINTDYQERLNLAIINTPSALQPMLPRELKLLLGTPPTLHSFLLGYL